MLDHMQHLLKMAYDEAFKKGHESALAENKNLIKQRALFYCTIHETKDVEFFCEKNREFICYQCMFDREITKKTALPCTEEDIISHAKDLLFKLN